ncbi:hypothetical protein ABTX81_14225 [Kitasatospora sp. NPDC097605]|uniref:DUF7507 domain-containing protein n=1 Tax=Kitasatospora sp. NPDC097605 TaxID=3157226 RepID=UPI00332C9BB8
MLSAGLSGLHAGAAPSPQPPPPPGSGGRVLATGTPLLQETFTGATADPRFTAVGTACLTGAPVGTPGPGNHPLTGCPLIEVGPVPPPNGAPHGYLQLTDAGFDEAGAVLFDQALPAGNGLDVTFDQWQYGSTTPATPADGISFFLVNGDTSLTHPGAFGGSLGYAQKLPDDNPSLAFLPGVDRGYLGVGLDVLGNYFGDWEHRGNGCAQRSPAGTGFRVPAPGRNMVTVRGPGDGTTGYCFLTATTSNFTTTGPWPSTLPGNLQGPLTVMPPLVTPAQAETLLEPSRRRVNVHLTPAPSPVLTVSVDFNDGTGAHQVLSTPAPQPVPSTYKFGFAGSTGAFTDVHLIRNVVVSTDQPLPALNLVKQVHQPLPGLITVGTPVQYDFVVTNSGNVAIDNLGVNDPKVGPVSCPVLALNPGQTVTCTATYLVTAADAQAGQILNTAVATGTADGAPVESPPSSETVPVVAPPGINLTKQVDAPGPFAVGDTVPYTYVVSNTGGVQVDAVGITDDRVTGITCDATTLAPAGSPGDSTVCHGSYVITQADADAGQVVNNAVANGTANGSPVTSPPAQATVPVVSTSSLGLTKQASTPGPVNEGDTVTYTYTVTNTGTTTLNSLTVTDDHVTPVTCGATTLTPGQSTTCTGTYVVTAADAVAGHVTNVATANSLNPAGLPVESPPAQVTLEVTGVAALSLTKQASTPGPVNVGDTITYTYTVTNTGTAAVHNLTVTDDHVSPVTCSATSLASGDSTTCTGSHVVTTADAVAGQVTNVATANALDPQNQPVVSPPAQETVPVTSVAALSLAKVASPAGPVNVGDTITYTYTVTNTGTAAIHNLTVIDDRVAPVTCAATSLASGQSTTCTGSYTVTTADAVVGQVINVATATALDPQNQPVESPPAQETVPVTSVAGLALTKQANTPGPVNVGDTITYTYTVTNTGTAAIHNLTVTDDHVSPVTCAATSLAAGQSTTCTGSYVVTAADAVAGQVTNVATANALDPQNQPVVSPPAQETVPVTSVAGLSLSKQANTAGPVNVGDTIVYTYTVTNTGTAAIHNLTVTDDLVTPVTCAATTLAAGQSTTCTGSYVVTTVDAIAGHVLNVATADALNPQGEPVVSPPAQEDVPVTSVATLTLTKQASTPGPVNVGDTITYTYTVMNTGTATVHNLTVTDDHVSPVTCAATTLAAGQSTTCTGSYVVTAADAVAGQVTNVATANALDPQNQPVVSPPAQETVPVTSVAALSLTKQANTPGPVNVGDTITYTYTVTNTGTAPVHNLTVTDDRVAPVTCAATSLAAGQSTTCTGSYVVTAADAVAGQVTNVATANALDPQNQPVVSPPAQETVPVTSVATLSLTKVANTAGPVNVGDTITYTYTVTNTGTVTVNNLTVTDDRVAPISCVATTLAAGQSTTCTGSYVVTAADAAAGSVTNHATANGLDPQGRPVQSPPAEETVQVAGATSSLSLTKRADQPGPVHPGDTIVYTYTVTNTGTTTLTDLTISDDRVSDITCAETTLAPGQSTTCTGGYVVTEEDAKAGHVTNRATANALDPDCRPVQSPPVELCITVEECPPPDHGDDGHGGHDGHEWKPERPEYFKFIDHLDHFRYFGYPVLAA